MCFRIYPLLLFIHLVEVRQGAIDGYIWAGPEEGSCFQLVTYGSEPDLRRGGKERKGQERGGEWRREEEKRGVESEEGKKKKSSKERKSGWDKKKKKAKRKWEEGKKKRREVKREPERMKWVYKRPKKRNTEKVRGEEGGAGVKKDEKERSKG